MRTIFGVVAAVVALTGAGCADVHEDKPSDNSVLLDACRKALPEVDPPRPVTRRSYYYNHFYCADAKGVLTPVFAPSN